MEIKVIENILIDNYKKAEIVIEKYGAIHQYNKLTEEACELYDALISNTNDYQNIVSECADVFFMLLQFYSIDSNFRKELDFKINRTLSKINESKTEVKIEE